jgi:hypothetical protein
VRRASGPEGRPRQADTGDAGDSARCGDAVRRRDVAAPRGVATVAALVVLALALAGCRAAATRPPEPDPTPRPTISPAVAGTQVQLDGALRARGLVLQPTELTVRPGEPPSLAAVPRTAFRAILPDDPNGGLIVVYELADAGAAAAAATDLAAFVTSGPGRVQYPPDARHVLRQVGSTIVFFPWSPASSPDPRTAEVAAAVATVGTEVPIPRG